MCDRTAAVLFFALTFASAGTAVRAEAQRADPPELRLVERSLFMFNQSLYHGSFRRPKAIAYDRKHQELWIADAGSNRIGIHRPDGMELFSFTSKEFIANPAALAVRPKGGVAVLEGNRRRIRQFNYRGEYEGDLALPDLGEKPTITAIAYDEEGQLYVGEMATSQIFVFRADGSLKFQFGSVGYDEGQFMAIGAIEIGPDGLIHVLDQRATAVQVFDAEGNFIRGWGKHEMGAQNVSLPSDIAIDSKGRVYLTDELRQQVKVYAPDGKFLLAFGGLGEGPGQLAFPTAIVIDENDRIYVCERQTSRVQVFELREEPVAAR